MAPFHTSRPSLSLKFGIWSFISSASAIWIILWVANSTGNPLLIGSFGASAVLLFAVPGSELTQPRNLIGGHLISAIVSVLIVYLFGSNDLTIGLGVGLSIFLMYLTRTLHPPGGATALIGIVGNADISFILSPILLGSFILLILALIFNNFVYHRKYPTHWL
jgi:CBS-domain-containing membrane protein